MNNPQTPAAENSRNVPEAPRKKEKKKKSTVRRVRTVAPMTLLVPFIMVNRIGSQNMITDRLPISRLEAYLKQKQAEGMSNISMMYLLIAAYIRTAAERPALNRFIRGQRIWTRDEVEVSLVIKKEMSLESPDAAVKIELPRSATMRDVYDALNGVITGYRENPGNDLDDTMGVLSHIPALLLKNVIWFLKTLDYFRLLPKFLQKVSPFHCSLFITSMGSLGIPPIYHHLYDFGTCPVFCAFGTKQRVNELNPDGTVHRKTYMDVTFVTDERICDGYYFASSWKYMKNILRDPWQLDNPPERVADDIP